MSAFRAKAAPFENFLRNAKDDLKLAGMRGGVPQNTRFIPRNFLIEERIDHSRADSYARCLPPTGPRDFDEWNNAHNRYLDEHVFIAPPATHDYRVVSKDNPSICPETFRAPLALSAFQETDLDTPLLRLVATADIAWLSGWDEDRIFALGKQVIADPRSDNAAWGELATILDEAYTGPRCQHRPVFAAFWEDFRDILRDPNNVEWANRIRDRVGLYHMSQLPAGGLPRRVFLFRYTVRDIPRHPSGAERRPIAIPSVIDQKLFEAFCPAPDILDRGRLVNLEDGAPDVPAREVLHLFMPMQVENLFRIGRVTNTVPEDLGPARRDHIIWLRLLSNRDDYASDTDGDLLC